MTARLMDRSLEAIRERAAASTVWQPGEVPQRVSDVLWAAVRDREALLEMIDRLLSEDPD